MFLPLYMQDEPTDIIQDEVTWLQGAFVSSFLCGVQVTLSIMSFCAVLKQRMHRRLRIVFLVYIFLLCAMMTAGEETNLLFVQIGFVERQNYPGGPNAFLSDQYSMPVDLASTSLFIFANWMMESLLVWRCKVVCCTGEPPVWFGVILPSTLLVAEFVTGSLFLHRLLQGRYPIDYAIAYASLSLLLNVTVTAIIAGRLLIHRRRMMRHFGRRYGSEYAGAATVLIESASLYTGFLILVIIFFTVSSSASNMLQQAVAQVQAITTLLIIFRIAQGRGWKYDAGVSTSDWREDSEAQTEQVEPNGAARPEQMVEPDATRTASIHVPPPLSQENETQAETSASSVNATLSQTEAGEKRLYPS